MIVLLRDDPMNVAGEIGGSGIQMTRPLLRQDLDAQALAAKFKAIAAFEFSGGTTEDGVEILPRSEFCRELWADAAIR